MADYDWFDYQPPSKEEVYADGHQFRFTGGTATFPKKCYCEVCYCLIFPNMEGMAGHRERCNPHG